MAADGRLRGARDPAAFSALAAGEVGLSPGVSPTAFDTSLVHPCQRTDAQRRRSSGASRSPRARCLVRSASLALRHALVKRPDVFVTTMTEKLLTYGLGRGLTYRDMPVVRSILRTAAADNYRFSSLVRGIVSSEPFRMRMRAGS